jgi:bifunctional UDP-N-acetylglucosamine pyrophosphorylase/glucosamine-1-phosphate N-acetyltransferase
VERASDEPHPSEPVTTVVAEAETAYGINDRVELAVAERIVRARINERLMRSGVTIVDPGSVFIDADVEIGPDSRIEPFTTIEGRSIIGSGCRIGPQSFIRDTRIGDDCEVVASMLEGASVGDRVHIGPYSHFRSGAEIADGAHIGNYVEIKNSTVGEETHIGHFSYVGDSQLGQRVNIGAGTITANYDGKDKHRTIIGDDAFIGSDTILRAPVEVG